MQHAAYNLAGIPIVTDERVPVGKVAIGAYVMGRGRAVRDGDPSYDAVDDVVRLKVVYPLPRFVGVVLDLRA